MACFCASQCVQRLRAELILAVTDSPVANHLIDWNQNWHTHADSSGNGHRLKRLTSRDPMVIWRGLGGHTLKKYGKDAKQLDRSGPPGNGHRLKKSNPSRPKRNLEAVRGSQIQKGGKDGKQLYRSGTNLAHVCVFIWEWT